MYVCVCKAVRVSDVERVAQAGCTTPDALIATFELDDPMCCGRCIDEIDEIVYLAQEVADRTPEDVTMVGTNPLPFTPRLHSLH